MRRQMMFWVVTFAGCAGPSIDEDAAGRYAVREVEVQAPETLSNGFISGLLDLQASPEENDLAWVVDIRQDEIGFGDTSARDGYAAVAADTNGATFVSAPFGVTLPIWSEGRERTDLEIPLVDAVLFGSVRDGEAHVNLAGLAPLDLARAAVWRDFDLSLCALVTGDVGEDGPQDDCSHDRSTWDALPAEITADGREAFRLEADLLAVRVEGEAP